MKWDVVSTLFVILYSCAVVAGYHLGKAQTEDAVFRNCKHINGYTDGKHTIICAEKKQLEAQQPARVYKM